MLNWQKTILTSGTLHPEKRRDKDVHPRPRSTRWPVVCLVYEALRQSKSLIHQCTSYFIFIYSDNVHNTLTVHTSGSRCIKLSSFMTKTICIHKGRNVHMYSFHQIYKAVHLQIVKGKTISTCTNLISTPIFSHNPQICYLHWRHLHLNLKDFIIQDQLIQFKFNSILFLFI